MLLAFVSFVFAAFAAEKLVAAHAIAIVTKLIMGHQRQGVMVVVDENELGQRIILVASESAVPPAFCSAKNNM
jgi:hypothetical protein